MATVDIKRLGPVEYTRTRLPSGIKGKTQIGELDAPLLISDELLPGAKLDWVVAHEAGHRLTIEMALVTVSADPHLLRASNSISQTLTHFFVKTGLKEHDLTLRHPEVKSNIKKIINDNLNDQFTEETLAREFVAEIFAGWATGESKLPQRLDSLFSEIVTAKWEGELPPLVAVDTAAFAIVHSEIPSWYDPRRIS